MPLPQNYDGYFTPTTQTQLLTQRKQKNNNEGFDNLHTISLFHVYVLAKIRHVK